MPLSLKKAILLAFITISVCTLSCYSANHPSISPFIISAIFKGSCMGHWFHADRGVPF